MTTLHHGCGQLCVLCKHNQLIVPTRAVGQRHVQTVDSSLSFGSLNVRYLTTVKVTDLLYEIDNRPFDVLLLCETYGTMRIPCQSDVCAPSVSQSSSVADNAPATVTRHRVPTTAAWPLLRGPESISRQSLSVANRQHSSVSRHGSHLVRRLP